MALKSVKSIILNSLIMFRQKLLSDTPVKNDSKHALSLAGAYNLKQSIFPVGSIYLSINNTNPGTFLGGTWELLPANYVLKTITSGNGGETYSAGNTGAHTLTTAQIPSHSHNLSSRYFFTTNAGYEAHGQSLPTGGISLYYSNGLSTDNSGGGKAHSHSAGMPANISVYAWKRTA